MMNDVVVCISAWSSVYQHCGVRRQAETWQHSLRGRTPDPEEGTGGLRAINLSFNPGIGDDGAYEMLHSLEDDTWTQREPCSLALPLPPPRAPFMLRLHARACHGLHCGSPACGGRPNESP